MLLKLTVSNDMGTEEHMILTAFSFYLFAIHSSKRPSEKLQYATTKIHSQKVAAYINPGTNVEYNIQAIHSQSHMHGRACMALGPNCTPISPIVLRGSKIQARLGILWLVEPYT